MIGSKRIGNVHYEKDDSLRTGPIEAERGLGCEVSVERLDLADLGYVGYGQDQG